VNLIVKMEFTERRNRGVRSIFRRDRHRVLGTFATLPLVPVLKG
jgi:hypothetical protein